MRRLLAAVLVARAGDLQAPAALKEDLELLAASDAVLEYLLESFSNEPAWNWPIACRRSLR